MMLRVLSWIPQGVQIYPRGLSGMKKKGALEGLTLVFTLRKMNVGNLCGTLMGDYSQGFSPHDL